MSMTAAWRHYPRSDRVFVLRSHTSSKTACLNHKVIKSHASHTRPSNARTDDRVSFKICRLVDDMMHIYTLGQLKILGLILSGVYL